MPPDPVFEHRLPAATWRRERDQVLVDLATGQRVLHVGCTDAPFTRERIASGQLLHGKLIPVAAEVVGVDVDTIGLAALAAAYGGGFIEADVTTEPAETFTSILRPTLILAADVIEHVPNEGGFLKGLAAIAAAAPGCRVVISTPNALAFRNTIYSAFGTEVIHPDHRRIHTPRTLGYSMRSAGLQIDRWSFYTFSDGGSLPRIVSDKLCAIAVRIRRGYSDGLIAEALPVLPS